MSNKSKQRRDLQRLAEAEGLTVVSIEPARRRSHFHILCRRQTGETRTFIASSSPSCPRSLANLRADLRRWAQNREAAT